jgi:nicotinamide-nucleotide amidase
MHIEIVTIGDELLLGHTIDTNGAHLARELAAVGISVVRRSTVGDGADEIAGAVGEALARTGGVITTGGLGPTADDLTKPAIATLFSRGMTLDEEHLRWMEERWRTLFQRALPASNRAQAMLPEGARKLVNRHGSAPGIWLEDDAGRWVAMLPGVPREMRGMLADTLLPLLRERAGEGSGVVRSRTLRTTSVAESALADRLGDLARGPEGLSLAYLPGQEGTDLRLTSRGLPADETDAVLARGIAALRERVGAFAYGEDGADLAALVLDEARAAAHTIAVAESCTGGLLGARLTGVAGSSDVVLGGVIAYANAVKVAQLGVDAGELATHGAVSEAVARAMADGVRSRFGAAIGVGITGVAGPGGGSADKPVGTVWIAVSVGDVYRAARNVFVGDRAEIRFRATQFTLDMLRRVLRGEEPVRGFGAPDGHATAPR